MPDMMVLAQAVLQIFCSQGCFTIYNMRKREIIQPNIYRILPKVNQVSYTLDTIYMLNIMIQAQAVLKIFCSQVPQGYNAVVEKRAQHCNNKFNRKGKQYGSAFFMLIPHVKFSRS